MKLIPLTLALAIGPFSLAAQSAPPSSRTSSTTFSVPMIGSGCPVSMQLRQRLGNRLETVQQDGTVYKSPATQLMLTVTGPVRPGSSASGLGVAGNARLGRSGTQAQPAPQPGPLRIVSATATAYGFEGRPHAELVSPGQDSRGKGALGPTRKVQLQFSAKDGGSVAELWLPSFGAVRWLDLQSIAWSDGSNWKPAGGQSCTVTPSLFMLVAADSQAGDTSLR